MMTDVNKYRTDFKLGREVLVPSGIPGNYDKMAVDCPFVFWHGGRYYMMHVGFDGEGYQTGMAVSSDLIHWEKQSVIFQREDRNGWDHGGAAGVWILKQDDINAVPTLKKVNGRYWMIYHSYPEKGYEAGPAKIGLAYTEDETLGEWIRLEQPVLSWEDGAVWEKGGLYKGCLLELDGRYSMYYNAKDSDDWIWHEQIGVAVSDDMTNWKRVFDEPVIKNTPGAWDSYFCADPCVVKDKDMWLMFYYGYDGKNAREGIAYSRDLLHWEKSGEPILNHGSAGEIDCIHAHKPSVISKDGCLYHFYCAVRQSKSTDTAVNIDPTAESGDACEYRCISVAVNKADIVENK